MPVHVHPSVVQQAAANPGSSLRLIVSKAAGATGVEEAVERLGARVTARWSLINAFAAEVPSTRVADLARLSGVSAVLSDSPVVSTRKGNGKRGKDSSDPAQPYVMAVRAHELWAEGITGAGVTVAVVDTGIYNETDGPSDFGDRVLASVAMSEASSTASDLYGHGTHVSGIIGGNGQNSGGQYKGIAPDVNLVSVKFADDQGNASERDLITALQWVYDHMAEHNIRVVNISATVTTPASYQESPTAAAVEQLWHNGIVVVTAAGNWGSQDCAVCYPPANDPFVITVGAIDDMATSLLVDDVMTDWSSRGSTQDGYAKPDLVAPGTQIISYMPVGALRQAAPANVVEHSYFRMGGTSMSAPVVSGVVALLLQARPDLSPDQVKWLLQTTARNYRNQPRSTPGIVDAQDAYRYKRAVDSANHGIGPSPLLTAGEGTIDYSNVLWGNVLWGNVLWGHSLDY